MSLPARMLNITVEEYLESEQHSQVRREFVDGRVYAMTGATDAHNRICGNLHASLHTHLAGSGCRTYINDMKVRIETTNCFYYPDLMVSCEPYSATGVFKNAPILIIEILSPSTKRIDIREKLIAYKQLPSLKEYVVVYQNEQMLEVHRRTSDEHWQTIVLTPPQNLTLESLSNPLQLSFERIYAETDLV